jgi:hypothetical protein
MLNKLFMGRRKKEEVKEEEVSSTQAPDLSGCSNCEDSGRICSVCKTGTAVEDNV